MCYVDPFFESPASLLRPCVAMSDPYGAAKFSDAAAPQPYAPGGLIVTPEGTHGPPSPPPQQQQPAYGYGQVPLQQPQQSPVYGAPAPQQQQMGAPSGPGAAYAPSPYGGQGQVPANMFAPEHEALFQQQQLQQQQMYAQQQAQQQPGMQPPYGSPAYLPPQPYGVPSQGAYAQYGQGNPNQPFLAVNPNGPPPVPVLTPMPVGRAVASGLEYQADANGEMRLSSTPGAMMMCFMCPFPFLCLGCCLSSTINTLFSDKTQTVEVDSYPGLCVCLAQKKRIAFNDIGNVLAKRGSMVVNGQYTFTVALQTKHGEQVPLTNADTMSDIGPKAAGIHAYLFGRGNPNYQPPNLINMLLGM